ncbi:hypothetical protein BHE74_00049186 [Ensete ventricosum]|nr:hypothetical protein BHE74_00049186 [Ensete ventricosum]
MPPGGRMKQLFGAVSLEVGSSRKRRLVGSSDLATEEIELAPGLRLAAGAAAAPPYTCPIWLRPDKREWRWWVKLSVDEEFEEDEPAPPPPPPPPPKNRSRKIPHPFPSALPSAIAIASPSQNADAAGLTSWSSDSWSTAKVQDEPRGVASPEGTLKQASTPARLKPLCYANRVGLLLSCDWYAYRERRWDGEEGWN